MSLDLIVGPMFSGKTTELIRRASRHAVSEQFTPTEKSELLIIKHSHDLQRTDNASVLRSHTGQTMPCVSVSNLKDIPESCIENAKYIFIEEGQFFQDLFSTVLEWVEHLDPEKRKHVTVAGLDGDIHRVPFGQIIDLVPYCSNIQKLSAICVGCIHNYHIQKDRSILHTDAPFTYQKVKILESPAKSKNVIHVGDQHEYEPLCRNCYLKKTKTN